jgi:hypothetical protein
MRATRSIWQLAPLAVLAAVLAGVSGAQEQTRDATNSIIELRGKVIPGTNQPVVFKAESGAVYNFVSNRMSFALLTDTNLQSKNLVLKGRTQPATNLFEVTGNLRSIQNGKLCDLFYFCEICTIYGIEPGPCFCCREPVILVERPVK